MKISELSQIQSIRRDIMIPLSVAGKNMSISLGQIMDANADSIVQFDRVFSDTKNAGYVDGQGPSGIGVVVFDTQTSTFRLAVGNFSLNGDTTWVLYSAWDTSASYLGNDGTPRKDCLFVTADGDLYVYTTKLKRVGITDNQANQIELSTPVLIASEEAMAEMIANGECIEGQIYYVAEE